MSRRKGCLDCGTCASCIERSAAHAEEANHGPVQARAVGNAVYLEHEGSCGDIAAYGAANPESAGWLADTINKALAAAREEVTVADAVRRECIGRGPWAAMWEAVKVLKPAFEALEKGGKR